MLGKLKRHDLERPVTRRTDALTQDQRERRDRFIERALAKLMQDDVPGFWSYLEAANFYVRKTMKGNQ